MDTDRTTGVRTFPSTPAGFDPHTAAPDAMWRHGLPPRPRPGSQPGYEAWWRSVFAGPMNWVEAEVSPDPVLSARRPFRPAAGSYGLADWAGAERQKGSVGFPVPATFIAARWQVPYVSGPLLEPLTVAFWCGLDGPSQRQVLQGGIAAETVGGVPVYRAWGEWFSPDYDSPACRFDNFPVQPGDVIACSVWAVEPDLGFVSIANVTRNHGAAMYLPAPGTVRSHGTTAEWVVEQVSGRLPMFTPMVFEGCVAGSASEAFSLVPGHGMDIVDAAGQPVTHTTVLTSDTILVRWAGYGDAGRAQPPVYE